MTFQNQLCFGFHQSALHIRNGSDLDLSHSYNGASLCCGVIDNLMPETRAVWFMMPETQ